MYQDDHLKERATPNKIKCDQVEGRSHGAKSGGGGGSGVVSLGVSYDNSPIVCPSFFRSQGTACFIKVKYALGMNILSIF